MAAELFALLSTTVSIAFQVKSAVEQIRYNRETHEQLVNRITSSLTQLQTETQKISRSSPGLIQAVQKLKSKLQHILGESQKPKSRINALSTWFLEWFYKDQVLSHLQDCERQLSFCFQEFGALGTVRVERKLGDHNIQVNRKLDELLRRTPAKTDGKHRSPVGVPIPLQARTSGSSMNSSEHSLDPPGLLNKRRKKAPVASLVRSESQTSASTVSTSHPSFRFNTYSPPITVMSGKILSPKEEAPTYVQRPTRSTGFLPTAKSDMTTSSIHIPLGQDLGKTSSLYEIHASTLDSECKRLRSLKHLSEALIPGRNAVALRRRVYATDRNVTAVTALARSLTYLARCLKDIHVDSHLTGSKVSVELRAVLLESAELYKTAFGKDKACRVDLATALYSLSALLSEPESRTSPSAPSLNTHISFNEIQRSKKLDAALSAAEEAVHHFTVLEKEDPDAFGMDLANALLNLSFILSDTGGHERALTISRKAVMLSYRLPLPHTQERARNIRTLHKALMRVSYCLDNLGRVEEAQEAENEANDVLRKPWFATGS